MGMRASTAPWTNHRIELSKNQGHRRNPFMQQVEESPAAGHSTLDGERELVTSTKGAVARHSAAVRGARNFERKIIVILFDNGLLLGSHSSNLMPRSLATVP